VDIIKQDDHRAWMGEIGQQHGQRLTQLGR
jgi:hypothetical protein